MEGGFFLVFGVVLLFLVEVDFDLGGLCFAGVRSFVYFFVRIGALEGKRIGRRVEEERKKERD